MKNKKGITLVSLVITIIVLLILAGVAINMAINSDGLFGKANQSAESWNTAVEKESNVLLGLEAKIKELELSKIIECYIDEIPVPKGFEHVEGTKETNFIIRNSSDGNEFVWITADAEELESRNAENVIFDESMYPESFKMIESVREYGGFYMARYSAGADNEITQSGVMEKVYSQSGKNRYICGTLKQMIDLCASMYPNNDTNKTGAVSTHPLSGMHMNASYYNMGWCNEEKTSINEWMRNSN